MNHKKTKYLFNGVVSGIGDYGNCTGIPTVAGECTFDKRYNDNYMSNYKGYYQTYDAGHIDEDGYIWIMSRTDDIINVAGHRLSTGAIEEVLSEHKSVAECAVVGISDKLKGDFL